MTKGLPARGLTTMGLATVVGLTVFHLVGRVRPGRSMLCPAVRHARRPAQPYGTVSEERADFKGIYWKMLYFFHLFSRH